MPRLASSSEAIASADWIAEVPVFPWPMCRKSLVFFTALHSFSATLALALVLSFSCLCECQIVVFACDIFLAFNMNMVLIFLTMSWLIGRVEVVIVR